MRKSVAIVLALAALAVPALAQISPIRIVRPVTPPPVQPVQSQNTPLTFDPALDPDRARALIAKLQAKNRDLRTQMGVTLGDLQALRAQLDAITSKGGSAVLAQCVSDTLSRRTDGGGEENCAASGYTCSAVEGTCHRQCTTTMQCSAGFVCDIPAAHCVVPPGDEG